MIITKKCKFVNNCIMSISVTTGNGYLNEAVVYCNILVSMLTLSLSLSIADRTQPTVPSPPATRTRHVTCGRNRHHSSAPSGGISDRSITWNSVQTIIMQNNQSSAWVTWHTLQRIHTMSRKNKKTCHLLWTITYMILLNCYTSCTSGNKNKHSII